MFSLEVGQWQLLPVKTHKGRLTESVVLFIYLSPVFQRTENENHVCCYLPYPSSCSTLLSLLLSAPCIINHTLRVLSSSECNSLFHSAQIFCYSKQKSVNVGQETKNIEIHMDHHSFVRSFTTRRTKFKRKSLDKQEQCLGDGEGDHCLREC